MAPSAASDEGEVDYLTMTFDDPESKSRTETLTQKKKRQAREAQTKGKPISKAELAAQQKAKRELALANNEIDTTSKGFKMMAKLGYKPGTALGAAREAGQGGTGVDDRLLEPVGLEMKGDRGGVGADAEKKRKFREEVAAQEEVGKKRKIDESEFRERQQREREEKKIEGQVFGAMKVCERLDEEDGVDGDIVHDGKLQVKRRNKPLRSVNVLWRGLVKNRAIQQRDRRMRYDLHQSLPRNQTYDDPDEDDDDRIAMGKKTQLEEVDIDLDLEDEELDEFDKLDVAEKLQKLVAYLRQIWHYCFWCKYRYPDAGMEGCPGATEEEHD
jgi:Domain of unknown function (DUF4187)/G-patch domain